MIEEAKAFEMFENELSKCLILHSSASIDLKMSSARAARNSLHLGSCESRLSSKEKPPNGKRCNA